MRYIIIGLSMVTVVSISTFTDAHQNYTDDKLWDRPYVALPETKAVKQTRPHMSVAYKPAKHKRKKSVVTPEVEDVAQLVRDRAAKKLGPEWAETAVRLAYVESGFDPKNVGPLTAYGRARGVLQVMPQTARDMGYNPSRLSELHYGLDAGLEHMSRCIESGVRTEVEMSRCHVSGIEGWKVRLNARAERYRNSYVRQVAEVDL